MSSLGLHISRLTQIDAITGVPDWAHNLRLEILKLQGEAMAHRKLLIEVAKKTPGISQNDLDAYIEDLEEELTAHAIGNAADQLQEEFDDELRDWFRERGRDDVEI